jgi:hypothetical protein
MVTSGSRDVTPADADPEQPDVHTIVPASDRGILQLMSASGQSPIAKCINANRTSNTSANMFPNANLSNLLCPLAMVPRDVRLSLHSSFVPKAMRLENATIKLGFFEDQNLLVSYLLSRSLTHFPVYRYQPPSITVMCIKN